MIAEGSCRSRSLTGMTKIEISCALLASALSVFGCGSSDCPTESGTGCAPQNKRIDLYTPAFSDPTTITNPLYPISVLQSVVFTGEVDGLPFRTETTLVPETEVFDYRGRSVTTLTSQYMAFRDGRLEEVALDWFAQDDAGTVWYFGEDVADYDETGEIISTEGTWRVGRDDAPPAMIMPAQPRVGDVWLAENIAPVAWEEITVAEVDRSVPGPSGTVSGVLVGSELHLDDSREEKLFAPGYGEFSTGSLENLEALALAIPADAIAAPRAAELDTLAARTADIFDAAATASWPDAETAVAAADAAWTATRSAAPPRLVAEMERLLALVHAAVAARSAGDARHTAIATARIVFDLWLRHEPPAGIDRVRFDLWLAQIAVDVEAGAIGPVRGDIATLALVWNRIAHTFEAAPRSAIEGQLAQLRDAAAAGDSARAATVAADLRVTFATLGWRR